VIGLSSLLTSGCASDPYSAPEPEFVPIMYLYQDGDKCQFRNVDDKTDIISPESQKWQFMYMAPIQDLGKINDKFSRCKLWE
jgi:hypothetical protein